MILLTIFFVFVPYIIMKISLVCEALKKTKDHRNENLRQFI